MRKRGPTSLRIDTPAQNPHIAIAVGNSSASPSTLSSATSESDYSPFHASAKARSLRNMKKLSLTIPSAQSSSNSLAMPEPQSATHPVYVEGPPIEPPRRLSIVSLPATNPTATLAHRKEEEGSSTVPYSDGPTQILPGIWLGSEDNVRDWKGLIERGIKSILNVAKEVSLPFDAVYPTRPFASTPNLKKTGESTYYPAHLPSGRPSMHYLKLQWSHGQQDLVQDGFPAAMAFTDAALERGEGVLVHCQCGISRSATMVIALVMRAAAQSSPLVPPEVWGLPGMQGAYSYVKEKSKWVGPNMSLIYQLLEYEGTLKCDSNSIAPSDESSVVVDEEEEWGRRRREMDETSSDTAVHRRESAEIMREAHALDKAMEERIVARKSSESSIASSSGVGMGPAWRSRYGGRKRTGSISSNMTGGSMLSENLVEEEEEEELLGIGGGFDDGSVRERCSSVEDTSTNNSPDDDYNAAQQTETPNPLVARGLKNSGPPPSAPVWKTSFSVPPLPATAIKLSFDKPSRSPSTLKGKRRPPAIGILPPVPSSPISVITAPIAAAPARVRTQSRKLAPASLHLRNLKQPEASLCNRAPPSVSTPSQTLFVFPPSPTLSTRTPSTMTLTSNQSGPVPFPSMSTPRVSTFRSHGRTKSFIGLGAPPTPTTACSRVDARGWVGLGLDVK